MLKSLPHAAFITIITVLLIFKWYYSLLLHRLDLAVSSQESFRNRIVALDCVHRKVLFLHRTKGRLRSTVIELDNVLNCAYRKVYDPGSFRGVPRLKASRLAAILLEFDQQDLTTVSVPFYHKELDELEDRVSLEEKARKWETMVRKLLPVGSCERERDATRAGHEKHGSPG